MKPRKLDSLRYARGAVLFPCLQKFDAHSAVVRDLAGEFVRLSGKLPALSLLTFLQLRASGVSNTAHWQNRTIYACSRAGTAPPQGISHTLNYKRSLSNALSFFRSGQ